MSLLKLLKYAAKWTTTTLVVGYLTYICHEDISRVVNIAKFYFNEAERGFVEKEHAFDLKIEHELDGKSNLETYVENYSDKLPVYKRKNGIMIGDARYNFSNFSSMEKAKLCRKK